MHFISSGHDTLGALYYLPTNYSLDTESGLITDNLLFIIYSNMPENLDQKCVNTIRTLSMDAVQKANSGHPGMPMGMADVAYVLWTRFLRHNPKGPAWFDRDRFILSAGHGSMLLYSLLYLTGYEVSLDDLKNFRQWGSITPGHPEVHMTPGVETTTGPLGQGFANGVGMAMGEAFLAETFNEPEHTVVDHYTYGIVSDGDLMEGISHEAASLAGHLKLGKLIYLYDDNSISIDGSTNLAFTENVAERFEAYHWHVLKVDGHDRAAVYEAIKKARSVFDRPSLIVCKTHIGFGSPNKQDSEASHGAALGEDEVRLTKLNLGVDPDKHFDVQEDVKTHFEQSIQRGHEFQMEWEAALKTYEDLYPEKHELFLKFISDEIPVKLDDYIADFEADEKGMATRKASGKVLNNLKEVIPNLIGGSADLSGSNNTTLEGLPAFASSCYAGRNVHYGVREHAMTAIMNGMLLHGGVHVYGGTFLIFSDYSRPAIRLAALSRIPTILIFTHDSIGLGEDGPTHQPVEQLANLRAIPNLVVIRPADANEVSYAWKFALERKDGPTALVLTRQNLPVLERNKHNSASNLEKGAYILKDAEKPPEVILIATGSEVEIALDAAKLLEADGIAVRVVSMPAWELFAGQPQEYRDTVLPPDVKARISVEAGSTFGWERWVGTEGRIIGFDHFGASAPYKKIYEEFGLTSRHIAKEAKDCINSIRKIEV